MSQTSQPSIIDVMTMFSMMMQTQERQDLMKKSDVENGKQPERERAEERKQAEVSRKTHEFTIAN